MVASKRKTKKIVSKTNVIVESIYCRKCMKIKHPKDFFSSVDDLDSNGYFSVCKDCCNELYDNYYRVEHDLSRTILRVCRKLNLRFDENAIRATELHLQTLSENNKESDNIIGIYKGKLASSVKSNPTDKNSAVDLTFSEPSYYVPVDDTSMDNVEDAFDLKKFWGENYTYEDYAFLENELSEWKKTHRCDTKGEILLLKELAYKSLEISKKRLEGSSTSSLVKELQELMKTASVDPAKTATLGAGKSQDTFSSFIKTIEENEPADYFKDKELFKDFDNIDWYFKKYITRPLKNFITQSRDFNVESDDDNDELGFDEIEPNAEDIEEV